MHASIFTLKLWGSLARKWTLDSLAKLAYYFRYLSLLLMITPPDSELFWFRDMSQGSLTTIQAVRVFYQENLSRIRAKAPIADLSALTEGMF